MAFLCVLVYTGLEGTWHGIETQLNQYIDDTNLADYWISATAFTEDDVKSFQELDGVTDTSLQTSIQVTARINNLDCGYLSLQTSGSQDVSTPIIEHGE
jgi:putative ABC transport system permease protein